MYFGIRCVSDEECSAVEVYKEWEFFRGLIGGGEVDSGEEIRVVGIESVFGSDVGFGI